MSSFITASLFFLLACVEIRGDVVYNADKISMPRFRFERWKDSQFQDVASQIAYDESTWETLSYNSIEALAFMDLETTDNIDDSLNVTFDKPTMILIGMGFTEVTWDCWINHYGGYYWSDLEEYKIAPYYEALGWTLDTWNSESDFPASSDKNWIELTVEERQAAANLCYIEQTWNQESFSTGWLNSSEAYLASVEPWLRVDESDNGPTKCPEVPAGGCSVCGEGECVGSPDGIFIFPGQPSVPCGLFENAGHFGVIPLDQCQFLSRIPQIEVCDCGSSIPGAPTAVPSMAPSQTFMPTDSILYNAEEISIPRFRFQRWNDTTKEMQDFATELAYTEYYWERMSTNFIEEVAFGDLDSNKLIRKPWKNRVKSEKPNQVLAQMGFTEDVWDCWINHYGGYEWDDLIKYQIAPYYEVLGWNRDAWNSFVSSDYPESNLKGWASLTPEEQQAATDLCFLERTWNEVPYSAGWLESSDYLATTEPWILYGSTKPEKIISTKLGLLHWLIIIAVAVTVVWIASVFAVVWCCRRRRMNRLAQNDNNNKVPTKNISHPEIETDSRTVDQDSSSKESSLKVETIDEDEYDC